MLPSKTLYYDVQPFLYYVMVRRTSESHQTLVLTPRIMTGAQRLSRLPHPRLLLERERIRRGLQRGLYPHIATTPTLRIRQTSYRVLVRAQQERGQTRITGEAVIGSRVAGLQGLLERGYRGIPPDVATWRGRDDRGDCECHRYHTGGYHVHVSHASFVAETEAELTLSI